MQRRRRSISPAQLTISDRAANMTGFGQRAPPCPLPGSWPGVTPSRGKPSQCCNPKAAAEVAHPGHLWPLASTVPAGPSRHGARTVDAGPAVFPGSFQGVPAHVTGAGRASGTGGAAIPRRAAAADDDDLPQRSNAAALNPTPTRSSSRRPARQVEPVAPGRIVRVSAIDVAGREVELGERPSMTCEPRGRGGSEVQATRALLRWSRSAGGTRQHRRPPLSWPTAAPRPNPAAHPCQMRPRTSTR